MLGYVIVLLMFRSPKRTKKNRTKSWELGLFGYDHDSDPLL